MPPINQGGGERGRDVSVEGRGLRGDWGKAVEKQRPGSKKSKKAPREKGGK